MKPNDLKELFNKAKELKHEWINGVISTLKEKGERKVLFEDDFDDDIDEEDKGLSVSLIDVHGSIVSIFVRSVKVDKDNNVQAFITLWDWNKYGKWMPLYYLANEEANYVLSQIDWGEE